MFGSIYVLTFLITHNLFIFNILNIDIDDKVTYKNLTSKTMDKPISNIITDTTLHQYLLPKENSVIFHKEIHLRWYNEFIEDRLQLSTDRNFDQILLDTILTSNTFVIPELVRHKTFYWRVFSANDHNFQYQECTFFKTTSIFVDHTANLKPLEIIPTWLDDKALLYIDNPEKIKYEMKISNNENEIIFYKTSKLEKYAFETETWPKGNYELKLVLSNNEMRTQKFLIR